MTRPIVWALGAFGSIAVAATLAGERLAQVVAPTRAPMAVSAGPTGHMSGPAQIPAMSPPPPTFGGRVETILGDKQGLFSVGGRVDGTRIQLMVDTGASTVALREEDAEKVGIHVRRSDFTGRSSTANGMVEYAPVRIRSLQIGDIEIRDVQAVVIPRGKLGVNLLGMSFLNRLRSFDIANNRITLKS